MKKVLFFTVSIMLVYANENILKQKDLPKITKCERFKQYDNPIKSCYKTPLILSKPLVKVKGKIIGFGNHKRSNYSILWIKTSNGYQVGCLGNYNDKKFDNGDNRYIGNFVELIGSTHHIEKHEGWKYNSLVLSRDCTIKLLDKEPPTTYYKNNKKLYEDKEDDDVIGTGFTISN